MTCMCFSVDPRVVLSCQDLHAGPRTLLPHGASFHGYPITINVSSDLPRQELTVQVCVLVFPLILWLLFLLKMALPFVKLCVQSVCLCMVTPSFHFRFPF